LAGEEEQARAILSRQPIIRFAHFLRAYFFRPSNEFYSRWVHEYHRSAASLRALEGCLRVVHSATSHSGLESLLEDTCRRIGRQYGTARGLRLLHGAPSASNIGIGGELLDFGMATATATFGLARPSRGLPDAWNQTDLLRRALADLLQNLSHWNLIDDNWGSLHSALSDQMDGGYHEAYTNELLNSSGLPIEWLELLSSRQRVELSDAMHAVASEGAFPYKPLCDCEEYISGIDVKATTFNLHDALSASWLMASDARKSDGYAHLAASAGASASLKSSVMEAWRVLSSRTGVDDSKMLYTVCRNVAVKSNKLDFLHHHVMNSNVDELCGNPGDIGSYISDVVTKAKEYVAPARVLDVPRCLAAQTIEERVHAERLHLEARLSKGIEESTSI
jgi:hypothetical protein